MSPNLFFQEIIEAVRSNFGRQGEANFTDVLKGTYTSTGGGGGDVEGPASSTDNAIARFDGTTGKIIQNSGVTVSDGNVVTATGFSGPHDGTVGAATPSTGAFTTITASSTITPSQTAGIVGTTTNNNANAGSVGEYAESIVSSGSAISLTTATDTNLTSVSLTAGDWNVYGYINYLVASGTTTTNQSAGLTSTSATMPALDSPARTTQLVPIAGNGSTPHTLPTPMVRFSLSGTTTVYLVGRIGFPSGSVTMNGSIKARRVR